MRMRLSVLALAAVAAARALADHHPNRLNRAQHVPPILVGRQGSGSEATVSVASVSVASGAVAAPSTTVIVTLASTAATSSRAPAPTSVPKPPSPAPSGPPLPVPTPLDTSISSTLSSDCMGYLTNLIADAKFTSCLPFSLLLQTSSSYKSRVTNATESGNYSYLNELLAYTSSPLPSADECDKAFEVFRSAVAEKSNCGNDLTAGKPVARQAARGIGNYAVLRTASALVNPKTGSYCYLESVASSGPDDQYLWALPAGNILPSSSTPTCSECSKLVMNHFGSWASNTTSLNSTILSQAATTINAKCGANFVSVVPTPEPSSTSSNASRRIMLLPIAAFVPLFAWVLTA